MRLYRVIKRNSQKKRFLKSKIYKSLESAFYDYDESYDEELYNKVVKEVFEQIKDKSTDGEISTELISLCITNILYQNNLNLVSEKYIIHRYNKLTAKNINVNIQNLTDNYLYQKDWRLKENSNFNYSVGGLEFYQSGAINARYWLDVVYPKKISEAHINGDIHISDLSRLSQYCGGFDITKLLKEGFKGVGSNLSSKPAKHLRSLINQLINFMGVLSNEYCGAIAINNFSTLLSPFIKIDNLDYKEIKQNIQNFVFSMNIPSRFSGQSIFSNITIDLTVPKRFKDKKAIVGGTEQEFTYGECIEEIKLINKAFFEVMLEGDAEGRPFSFPIPTINIDKDFNWNEKYLNKMWEATGKYGYFYFANYINSSLDSESAMSMCCRLRLSLDDIAIRSSGLLGGSGDKSTGSIGVVTVNLPRIGYLSKNKKEFKKILEEKLELCYESLEIKRKILIHNLKFNLYPYTKWYLENFDMYFSTIGLNGMHEACLNMFKEGIESENGKEFAIEIMDLVNFKVEEFKTRSGNLYNHEQVPGEGLSTRLAQVDKKKYPDIITSGDGENIYYTSSTLLPSYKTEDLFFTLDHQNDIQTLFSAGSVLHLYLGEAINDIETVKNLIQKICKNYKLPYISLTPTYSTCRTHGYISGEHFNCPTCGEECLVFSRVVGYYRPVQNYNIGKRREYSDRKKYSKDTIVKKEKELEA
jgi:ribonucleoside-triphosphate reductase